MLLSIWNILDNTQVLFLWQVVYWFDDSFYFYQFSNVMLKAFWYNPIANSGALIFTTKVVLGIVLLISIRGGVPRYRYDFLTKLGWIKFLVYMVVLFVLTFLLAILV